MCVEERKSVYVCEREGVNVCEREIERVQEQVVILCVCGVVLLSIYLSI